MVTQANVEFEAEGGVKLCSCLFTPAGASRGRPAITIAHGYAGIKEMRLDALARAFADVGFVVWVQTTSASWRLGLTPVTRDTVCGRHRCSWLDSTTHAKLVSVYFFLGAAVQMLLTEIRMCPSPCGARSLGQARCAGRMHSRI
jgi:hypothetical protein